MDGNALTGAIGHLQLRRPFALQIRGEELQQVD
jgi:hypothetical protein